MPHRIVLGRSKDEREELGIKGAVFIGKQYVTMGKTTSMANEVYLDVAKPHVILVSGKRGSGKSYTMSVIAEGVAEMPEEVKNNLSCLFFDTMGIFWSMKYPNYRQRELLDEWGIEPKDFSDRITVFVPKGAFEEMKEKGIPVDEPFSLRVSDLDGMDWCSTFGLSLNEPLGVLILRVIDRLRKKGEPFDITDVVDEIEGDERAGKDTKEAAIARFRMAEGWGIFDKEGTSTKELLRRGKVSVLDISCYSHVSKGFSIRALAVALLAREILRERMTARKIEELASIQRGWSYFKVNYKERKQEQIPLVWIFIDEAHEFLPRTGETIATGPLIQLIREGRQPGISLVLATQQPGKIHTDVMTQCDLIISHRVTSSIDVKALSDIMQSYMPYSLVKYLDALPKSRGAAIALDDKQERVYPIQIRPKYTWHGGEEPSAI
ncbi:MAG TPA: ATP-binding protein [Candidatus Aenigmarchaeota archaeon]|nr:ATP-binding protein [Candidatus Aenigmarchaeota archaeon]